MIKSYKPREFPESLNRRVKMRLDRINAAAGLDDLRVPPSHGLEALGGAHGRHAINIDARWRICFTWQDGHACSVEVTRRP